MVAGFDRYFQIARCLRDEDLRADRQPEFTQIDLEMSFVGEEDVFDVVEGLMAALWRDVPRRRAAPAVPAAHVPTRRWRASARDKPDLRFGLELARRPRAFAARVRRSMRSGAPRRAAGS